MRDASQHIHSRRSACSLAIGFLLLVAMAAACKRWDDDPPDVPSWTKTGTLPDGRVFVTDGAIALDAHFALVDVMPAGELTANDVEWLQSMLQTWQPNECRHDELKYDSTHNVWKCSEVHLNPLYVTYLRYSFPGDVLAFRANKPRDPVLILVGGAVIGVVMPMDPS